MGTLRFVIRQVRTDGTVAALLAVVVVLGCALGAAAPPWINNTLNDALDDTIATSNDTLTLRERDRWMAAADADRVFEQPAQAEPLLAEVFGDGRWAFGAAMTAANDQPSKQMSLRVAQSINEHVTITEGSAPAQLTWDQPPSDAPTDGKLAVPTVDVMMTAKVAEVYGVAVNDTVELNFGSIQLTDGSLANSIVEARVTGLFEPKDLEWPGWGENEYALQPHTVKETRYAAMLAPPDVLEELKDAPIPVFAEWILEPRPTSKATDPVQVTEAIRRLEASSGWFTQLDTELDQYITQLSGATRVNALGATSLGALFVIFTLLTVRMLAGRRSDALHLAGTRGSRARTSVRNLALEATLIGLPAAAAGVWAGTYLVDEPIATQSMVIPLGIVVLTIAAYPAIALRLAAGHTTGRPELATLRPSSRHVACEAGFVILAAAVLWLLSGRTASGTGVDPIVSLTPILVASAVGLVTFRAMPYLVTAATWWTRRGRGAASFLSAAQAARGNGSSSLPVIAIMIAIGLAGIGASVNLSAEQGPQAKSWSQLPADVAVAGATNEVDLHDLESQLPGATVVAAGYVLEPKEFQSANRRPFAGEIVAVDAESWQQITDEAPGELPVVSALNSASASHIPAVLTGSSSSLWKGTTATIDGVAVTVTAEVSGFPGLPSTPSLIVPASVFEDHVRDTAASIFFIGGDVDEEAAAEVLGGTAYSRADILAEIGAAPLLSATSEVYRVAIVGSAILAASAAVLSLLIAGRARAHSLSVLHTLGLTHRQATGVVLAETLPPTAVAAALGVGVGTGVTVIAADALDLTALTNTLGGNGEIVLDVAGTALTAAAVLAVVLISIAVTVLASRRTQLGQALRVGE
jgi:putative ABC transport system permease protein